jgi:hypothetical protein
MTKIKSMVTLKEPRGYTVRYSNFAGYPVAILDERVGYLRVF